MGDLILWRKSPIIDIVGRRFGRLIAVELVDQRQCGFAVWRCVCDCGRQTFVRGSNLRTGRIKSCGCLPRRKGKGRPSYKHGHSKPSSPTYTSWSNMKRRCYNSNHGNYKYYGGRGIRVCGAWRTDFKNFLQDMGERPPGLQIGRIDNNKGYEPGNCRWETRKENCNNRRTASSSCS